MPIFALVDCNNFYASCERVFNPDLENKPIIVLSNNDGCIIARSNEAKKLGVPMGAPFYQWKTLCDKKILHAFSSNYALYGDMSNRVMTSLRQLCPDMEIYSIDEAFLSFNHFNHFDLLSYITLIKQQIRLWTGIPVSIGIAATKTLAKIANHIAKKKTSSGIFDLRDTNLCETILSQFPIRDVWGIGSQLAKKLNALNIMTAKDLRDADMKRMRLHFSVVLERIVRELRGISCLPLETIQAKQQIISSRSFGKLVTEKQDLEEAISYFTAKACIKLRRQNSLASGINIFLHTNFFNEKDPQYGNHTSYHFPEPTDDSSYIISIAKKCLINIFKKGYRYQKAGIMLLDLSPKTIQQCDLFSQENKNSQIMKTMDAINEKIGRRTLFFCAEGIDQAWQTRCQRRSSRYTTQWDELVKVLCA